ncbi:cysteine--tRNA ligase, partial [candidate division WWE3 bacterium CG_4_10_14_0_2_um_filter_42_8]
FKKRIDNDLNLPQALAWLWEILRSEAIPAVKKATVLEMDQVLGLRLDSVKPFMIPEKIRQLAEMRERARRKKDFKTADELREEIKNLGYEIEDTREGYQILPL